MKHRRGNENWGNEYPFHVTKWVKCKRCYFFFQMNNLIDFGKLTKFLKIQKSGLYPRTAE